MSTIELLTKSEAAERARTTPRALHRLISIGAGPTVTKIGGRALIRAEHLDEWIERQARPPRAA